MPAFRSVSFTGKLLLDIRAEVPGSLLALSTGALERTHELLYDELSTHDTFLHR
jgi:hypothetical protein